ncbi:hypothetical protein A9Q84_17270 [Halobacteriovorax marinus]|uniref:Peptidase C45 hydrolase domain-containing protein n=1 Tax=Halobacteriovorax marinus TaxID=97084 RepID=A0A1Y5FA43_9BACT|nr:hypothetical protein A9Q84_17270 [Halobacteriovorax marinus]
MTDYGFPILKYEKGKSFNEWGIYHGEEFRGAIKELVQIRKHLMLQKNPALRNHLKSLAHEQFEATKNFAPGISRELEGIATGSGLTLEDIVILNNYTDFRDITLPDEGCSTIQIQRENTILSGQTWDMHSSAKNFLSIIEIPESENGPSSIILSLLGCTGLMGINSHQCLIGVNNINTTNAKVGMIWPVLVRQTLLQNDLNSMRKTLLDAPVTSGHNYLISSKSGAEHWEITPTQNDLIHAHGEKEIGHSFHTNHCLGEKVTLLENKKSISATTFARFELLEKKVPNINSYNELKNLLQGHDGYPKSICSHYDTGAKDPSMTCGGGIADLNEEKYVFWRGCSEYDKSYKEANYIIDPISKNFKRVVNE